MDKFYEAQELMQTMMVWMVSIGLIIFIVYIALKMKERPLRRFMETLEENYGEWKKTIKSFFNSFDNYKVVMISFVAIIAILITAIIWTEGNKKDVITAESFLAFGFETNYGGNALFGELLDFNNAERVKVGERIILLLPSGEEFKARLKEVYIKKNEYVFSYSVGGVPIVDRGTLQNMQYFFKDKEEFTDILKEYDLVR